MQHDRAYQCKTDGCSCNGWLERHCPKCGELYLWDNGKPQDPCLDCELNETDAMINALED